MKSRQRVDTETDRVAGEETTKKQAKKRPRGSTRRAYTGALGLCTGAGPPQRGDQGKVFAATITTKPALQPGQRKALRAKEQR